MAIIAFERDERLSNNNNTSSERFDAFLREMTRQVNDNTTQIGINTKQIGVNTILTGTGSPEGVVIASAPKFYFDSSAEDYYKKTGTGDTGWLLI